MRMALAGLSLILSINLCSITDIINLETETNTAQIDYEIQENKEIPASQTVIDTELYAKAAVLLDADSGRILYNKNGSQVLPMASTTKIMTCIIALENANLEDKISISKYAASMPDVQLNVNKGEQYYLKDLLHSLMLESHNDAAVAIAEYIGSSSGGSTTPAEERSVEESKDNVLRFAKMMNQKAKDIGCINTYFITPNGLDAKQMIEDGTGVSVERVHSTTAADLANIMKYCIKDSPKQEAFLEITRTPSYSFADINGKRNFSCNNHNAFLSMMEGALSGKTGFTGNAGYCYVGALEREDKSLIVALLACGWPNNKTYKWSDTRKLMNYGLENYTYKSFNEEAIEESELESILVEDGQTERLGEEAKIKLKLSTNPEKQSEGMLMRADEEIKIQYNIPNKLEAPVEAGTVVGSIRYLINEEVWKVDNVVTNGKIDKINIQWCINQLLRIYCL